MSNKVLKNSKEEICGDPSMEDLFVDWRTEGERIKKYTLKYKNKSICDSFGLEYNEKYLENLSKNDLAQVNSVYNLEVGNLYKGRVKWFSKDGIVFEVPGVKDDIICRENLMNYEDNIKNYLLTHDNSLIFEVLEKQKGKFIVGVINAYYRKWVEMIDKAIKLEQGIQVHIDDLVNGGYVCKTIISTLYELTGVEYTSSVFIPGSHIVLNIERNFEQWIGQDVIIVPQKFVNFKYDFNTGLTEKSLVGSRKRVLQIIGMKNMYDLYNNYKLSQLEGVKVTPQTYDGVVTGIINSQKKQGCFVEMDDKFITGLLPLPSDKLLDFKPGDPIKIKIKEFEIQPNSEPFILNKKGTHILKCNVRAVFELV